jgi:hypothetical protein
MSVVGATFTSIFSFLVHARFVEHNSDAGLGSVVEHSKNDISYRTCWRRMVHSCWIEKFQKTMTTSRHTKLKKRVFHLIGME